MKTIEFKSTPENFRKEYLGLKRNTVRRIDESGEDKRYSTMLQFMFKDITVLQIIIINTLTEERFTRQVKDITKWDGIYIISW